MSGERIITGLKEAIAMATTTNPVDALREALKADDRNNGKPYAARHAHLKYAVECWLNDNRDALSPPPEALGLTEEEACYECGTTDFYKICVACNPDILALPARFRPTLDGEAVERVARALAADAGYKPSALEPGDDPYGNNTSVIDGYRNGEPCHFIWRHFDSPARAALAAMGGET